MHFPIYFSASVLSLWREGGCSSGRTEGRKEKERLGGMPDCSLFFGASTLPPVQVEALACSPESSEWWEACLADDESWRNVSLGRAVEPASRLFRLVVTKSLSESRKRARGE